MRTTPNRGHHSGKNTRSYCVFTVYNNKTDFPVIVDGEARECAKAMGISELSFYYTVNRVKAGKNKKWTILKSYIDDLEED
jgi:hypothetical protein